MMFYGLSLKRGHRFLAQFRPVLDSHQLGSQDIHIRSIAEPLAWLSIEAMAD
ncbi:MAG: hypothetical protein AAFR73_11745 [Pseudomonadota bacterium]